MPRKGCAPLPTLPNTERCSYDTAPGSSTVTTSAAMTMLHFSPISRETSSALAVSTPARRRVGCIVERAANRNQAAPSTGDHPRNGSPNSSPSHPRSRGGSVGVAGRPYREGSPRRTRPVATCAPAPRRRSSDRGHRFLRQDCRRGAGRPSESRAVWSRPDASTAQTIRSSAVHRSRDGSRFEGPRAPCPAGPDSRAS